MTDLLDRVAGAPITWGVCEVPAWGHRMEPDRVLSEMASIGMRATELGPAGFLPTDPSALQEVLRSHGLRLVGGFVPVVLHRPESLAGRARRSGGSRHLDGRSRCRCRGPGRLG